MRSHTVCRLSRSYVTMKTVKPRVFCSVPDQCIELTSGDWVEP